MLLGRFRVWSVLESQSQVENAAIALKGSPNSMNTSILFLIASELLASGLPL